MEKQEVKKKRFNHGGSYTRLKEMLERNQKDGKVMTYPYVEDIQKAVRALASIREIKKFCRSEIAKPPMEDGEFNFNHGMDVGARVVLKHIMKLINTVNKIENGDTAYAAEMLARKQMEAAIEQDIELNSIETEKKEVWKPPAGEELFTQAILTCKGPFGEHDLFAWAKKFNVEKARANIIVKLLLDRNQIQYKELSKGIFAYMVVSAAAK